PAGGSARGILRRSRYAQSAPSFSIRQTPLCGEGVEPVLAEHVRGERERAEQVGEGRVADVEAAGEGAESRHDETRFIGREAAAAHRAAAMSDARRRMQMAADFAGAIARQVAERQRAEREARMERAADAAGR